MNNNTLPLVVCVSTPERKINYRWFNGSNAIIDPNIAIETIYDLQNQGCTIPSDIRVNDLLILHPYEQNTYIRIEDVESNMIKATKFFKYSEILQELGAVSYRVTSGITKVYKSETDVDGKVSFKKITTPIELRVDVNNEKDFLSKLGFELYDTFEGVRTISQKSYKSAKELVKQYRLQDDEYIKTLIKKRNPNKENHKTTEHLHCEAMREFNKCIDVAVAFNAATVFEFSASVRHAISEKVEYCLDIDVTFPEQ